LFLSRYSELSLRRRGQFSLKSQFKVFDDLVYDFMIFNNKGIQMKIFQRKKYRIFLIPKKISNIGWYLMERPL